MFDKKINEPLIQVENIELARTQQSIIEPGNASDFNEAVNQT